MPRWNASEHPRYPNGQFRPKFSQSVRLSPISISYNAGVRIPIVPGRANLYVGALARVERSGGGNFLKKQTDKFVNSIAGRLGDEGGRSNVSQLLKGNEVSVNGLRIKGPAPLHYTPTFRVSSTPNSRAAATGAARVRRARARPSNPGQAALGGVVRSVSASPRSRVNRAARGRSRRALSAGTRVNR